MTGSAGQAFEALAWAAGTSARASDGGSVTIVVGAARPPAAQEPHWLNTFGWDRGRMIFRYLFPEAKPSRPEITIRSKGN